MKKSLRNKKLYLVLSVLCLFVLAAVPAACSPASNSESNEVSTPEADEFGVITAESWKDIHSEVYASYQANVDNAPGEEKHKYLELYPALSTLYAGFGFSKGYDEPASHLYSLDSILATPRISENSLANCITCKSPQYTALVNENGVQEYSQPFAETVATITEPISCYNCHENDPTSLTVGNQFFVTAIADDTSQVPMASQVCGQCHNEYYFNPETKATTLPYSGLKAMNPESILAYYDELGFSDWTYPTTGTPMLKTQHPEFETIYGGETPSHMASLGYSCSDCHMGSATSDEGTTYTSHTWTSPLENKQLLETNCNSCHTDLKSQVAAWQEASEMRVQSISLKLEDMVNKMTEQVEAGSLTGDKLTELQKLHRSAQWYWDFVMVENSEGAHNPTFSNATLDMAEKLVDEALAKL